MKKMKVLTSKGGQKKWKRNLHVLEIRKHLGDKGRKFKLEGKSQGATSQ